MQIAFIAILVGKTVPTELEAAVPNSTSVVNGLTLVLLPGNLILKAVSAEAHARRPSPLLPVVGDCIPLAVPHFFVEHVSKIKELAQVTAVCCMCRAEERFSQSPAPFYSCHCDSELMNACAEV
jgi:hypothetical protein